LAPLRDVLILFFFALRRQRLVHAYRFSRGRSSEKPLTQRRRRRRQKLRSADEVTLRGKEYKLVRNGLHKGNNTRRMWVMGYEKEQARF
jgi:hypothetical protein